MTKRKKLVCRGWGIEVYRKGNPCLAFAGCGANSKTLAIMIFNRSQGSSGTNYTALRKQGFAIARKLWVEVDR